MVNIMPLAQKYRMVIAYLIFGVLTTAINIITYHICYNLAGISNLRSTVISWIVAVAFAFLTNKPIVFESKSWKFNIVMRELFAFLGCRIGTGVVEVALMYITVDLLRLNGVIMKTMTNIVVIVLNYVASKTVIFTGASGKQ